MSSQPRAGLMAAVALLGACGSMEVPPEGQVSLEEGSMLVASVRFSDAESSQFMADEAIASLESSRGEHKLILYARAYDLLETLAIVIDLNSVAIPGEIDLSTQGVLYLEPGFGLGGADLIFDEEPSGVLEVRGTAAAGEVLSGSFDIVIRGYDTARPAEDLAVSLEGQYLIRVEAQQRE